MNNQEKFPEIKTERLLLRRFQDSDLTDIFQALSDPEIIVYYGVSFSSLEESKTQLEFFRRLETEGSGIWWAICSADNSTFYGACGFNDLDKTHQKAEIGYWLHKKHWSKGIISEALPLICKYGFEVLQLHRIQAMVETENNNSNKLLEKMTFNLEGCLRDCEFKYGKFISLNVFAKLKGD